MDERHVSAQKCSTIKADGERCRAWALKGRDVCAGHAGLGLAADPQAAGRKGSLKSAEVRAERAEIRKRGVRQALADAVEHEYLDKILGAYSRGLEHEDAAVAVRSAEAILSRVYGRPKETIETVDRPHELKKVYELSVEERDALWRKVTDPDVSDDEVWAVFNAMGGGEALLEEGSP